MKIDNIIPSTLKVIASENLNIQKDLESQDSDKPLELLLNEQKETQKDQKPPSR
jgi:hypothetical protein